MSTARVAAPEIDRLVLSVSGAVGPRHGGRIGAIADGLGMEGGAAPLPNLTGFLRAGVLTDDLATTRMRYLDPVVVTGQLSRLVELGLLERTDRAYAATDRVLPLLDALDDAVADVAASAWSGHGELVETASGSLARVAAPVPGSYSVAVAHRELAEPDDPSLRLFRRLVTVRLVRHHDHATAWLGRHLTVAEMPVMTALWHDDTVEPDHPALALLVERGFAEADPPRLTARGRRVREAIEDDTNALNQRWFDVLGDEDASTLVDALRRLPSATP